MNKDWTVEVQLYGSTLQPGASSKVVCPKCGDKKYTMSVGKDTSGRLYAKCHRLACGVAYRTTRSGRYEVPQIGGIFKRTPTPYIHDTLRLRDMLGYICSIRDKYWLSGRTLDTLKWCVPRAELVMPCYDINGCQWGVTTKSFDRTSLKAKHYNDIHTDHWVAFHSSDPSYMNGTKGIVMVEDWLSASRYCDLNIDAIAILGTNATPALLGLLATHYKYLIVSLDPDATTKSISIVGKSQLLFEWGAYVLILPNDPKETHPIALRSRYKSTDKFINYTGHNTYNER